MAQRGRPPSAKTLVDRQLGRNRKNVVLPAGDSYIIPNLSGVDNYIRDVAGDPFVRTAGDTMTGDLNFGDNVDINMGNSTDVKLYFDGTLFRIEAQGVKLRMGQILDDIFFQVDGLTNTFTFDNSAQAGVDITLDFVAQSNNGQIKWMEDEDHFAFADDIVPVTDSTEDLGTTALRWRDIFTEKVDIDIKTGDTKHFKIGGTESTRPSSGPKYFDLDVNRTWTGAGLNSDLMNVTINDDRDISSGTEQGTIFHFLHDAAGLVCSGTGAINSTMFRVDMSGTTTWTSGLPSTITGFSLGSPTADIVFTPSISTSSDKTFKFQGFYVDQTLNPNNTSSGTLTDSETGFFYDPTYAIQLPGSNLGPDVRTVYGFRYEPSGTNIGGTRTTYGLYYNPSWTDTSGTNNHYVVWAEKDDIILDNDSGKIIFGEGQDGTIHYDGTNLIVNPSLVGTGHIDLKCLATAIEALTGNTTLDNTHSTVTCGAGNETFTVTLPAVSGVSGRIYTIKNVGTGTITVDGASSETIDSATTAVISSQFDSITIQCDGTEWWII